jgi:hypothetical protein
MGKQKRTLPCDCVLIWDEEHTLIAFCVAHSLDYLKWKGRDEDFIKRVTNTQREIGYIDETILTKMR